MRNQQTTPNEQPALLLSVIEAADTLGIGRTNVYTLIKSGRLKSIKLGGRRMITRTALEQFVAELEAAS